MLNSRDRSAARLFSRHSTGGAIVIMDTNIVVRSEADLLALMAALNLNGAPLLLSQTLPPIPMTSVMANFPPPPPPPCHCLQHAFQSITPRPCIQGINMRMRPGWGVPVQSGYVISPRPIMPCVPPRPTHFLGGMMGEPIYPVSVRVTQPRPQQLLRPVPVQQQPRANQIYQMGSAQLPAPVLTSDTLEAGNRSPQCQSATIPGRDCIICYAKPVDCVLYSCGHMYFCYDCALMLSDTTGLCPICRAPILDVIRTYSP